MSTLLFVNQNKKEKLFHNQTMDTSENNVAEKAASPAKESTSMMSPTSAKNIEEQLDLNLKNESKFRENIYRLIISQLFYDGYQHIAVGLSGSVQVNLFNVKSQVILHAV